MSSNIVLNPVSNRFIKVGGFLYNRLLKEGLMTPQDTPIEPIELSPEPIPDKEKLATLVKETAHDIVSDNEHKFKNLTQKETTSLLHKLLLEKLCSPKSKTKSKPKVKKKPKFKLIPIQESEDYSESSESDS